MAKPLFAFFGTPRFATVVLDALEAHGFLPALVVCAPDRKAGRGQEMQTAPVKAWAIARGIDIATPPRIDASFIAELQNSSWDVFCTAAYGMLLPKELLALPRCGALNVHPSLLPKFRGPSPVLSAILADEHITGVTIMQMDEKMDHGPIVAQGRIELEAWPPHGSVFEDLLATEGGDLLSEVLPLWFKGDITPLLQDEAAATYSKKFTDADAHIDLGGEQRTEFLKIRAFDRNPRAYFFAHSSKEGKKIRVLITAAEFREGKIVIQNVIPEGKKEMKYEDFLRGGATVAA